MDARNNFNANVERHNRVLDLMEGNNMVPVHPPGTVPFSSPGQHFRHFPPFGRSQWLPGPQEENKRHEDEEW